MREFKIIESLQCETKRPKQIETHRAAKRPDFEILKEDIYWMTLLYNFIKIY